MDEKDVWIGMTVVCRGHNYKLLNYGDKYKVRSKTHGILSVDDLDGTHMAGTYSIDNFEPVPDVEHKFHVGQPVKTKTGNGEVYIIEALFDHSLRYEGSFNYFKLDLFEPAYELEVGCKVRALGNYTGLGDGIVKKYTPGCMVDVLFDGTTYQANISQKDLIVLEPAHRKFPGKMFEEDDIIHSMVFAQSALDDITKKNIKMFLAGTPYFVEQPMYSKYIHDDCVDAFNIAWEDLERASRGIYSGSISFKPTYGTWDPALAEKFKKHLRITIPELTEDDFIALRESVKNIRIRIGGNRMLKDVPETMLRELAVKMKDEYVGSDKEGNRGRGTVFLKKAGECAVKTRDVSIHLADADVQALLKKKGISESLGDFQIQQYSNTLTVGVIRFQPLKKPEEPNEED